MTQTPSQNYTEARPWGEFTVLMDGDKYKIKRIEVQPGQRLSLQSHEKREEHWIVAVGQADITVGEETKTYGPGQYVFIPTQTKHRIANTGSVPVEFIEVQLGSYFGEDDIVRYQDDYNRDSNA